MERVRWEVIGSRILIYAGRYSVGLDRETNFDSDSEIRLSTRE